MTEIDQSMRRLLVVTIVMSMFFLASECSRNNLRSTEEGKMTPKIKRESIRGDIPMEIAETIRGLLLGMKVESKDEVDLILACVSDFPEIVNMTEQMIAEFEHTNLHDFTKLMQLISHIMEFIAALIRDLEPCVTDYPDILHIIAQFKEITIQTWVQTIMNDLFYHGGEMYADIVNFINDAKADPRNYTDLGLNVGELAWMLVFGAPKNFSKEEKPLSALRDDLPEDIIRFIEGFAQGMQLDGEDANMLVACLVGLDEIEPNIRKLIAAIEEMDWHNIDWHDFSEFYDIATDLYKIIMIFVDDTANCWDSVPEFKHIIEEFKNMTMAKWYKILLDDLVQNGAEIVNKVLDLVDEIKDKNYLNMGKDVGYLIWVVIFGKL